MRWPTGGAIMRRSPIPTLLLGVFLAVAALASPGPAAAQGCYGPQEIRSAINNGQIISLRNAVGPVLNQLGGSVVSRPTLCQEGGRLVYRFTVLSGGRTIPVAVDARTGAANY